MLALLSSSGRPFEEDRAPGLIHATVERTVYRLNLTIDHLLDLRDPSICADLMLATAPRCFLEKDIARATAQFIRRTSLAQAILVPSVAMLDNLDRWTSFRDLQGYGGSVPETVRSGKHLVIHFRFACNTTLRAAIHQLAFLSLPHSTWARAYYDSYRERGHTHHEALRALGAKWLKIIFVLWKRQVPYSETHHLANIGRQHLRQKAA